MRIRSQTQIEQDKTENIKIVDNLINTIFPQPELKKLFKLYYLLD